MMLELVIPMTAIALLFVAWALCIAAANEPKEAEPKAPENWDWPPRPVESTRDELHAFYPALAFITETHRREVRARDDSRP